MICWSCERDAGDSPACVSCGAILPPQAGLDHFAVLGLPRRHDLDMTAAEQQFRTLSRQFHPDRFAKADPRARRASLQRSVQVNEAWRTIKDPQRRAEYLLRLAGYELAAEEGASRPGGTGEAGARERIPVPAALLGEILELREELADARTAGDDAHVQRMATDMRQRIEVALRKVAGALADDPGDVRDAGGRTADLEMAAREMIAVRYFRRFLDEVAVHEEAAAARDEGAAHA